jgi:hypothetical protein
VASTRPTVDPESFILRTSGLLDGQTCTREALTFPACSALSSLCSLIADPSPPSVVLSCRPSRDTYMQVATGAQVCEVRRHVCGQVNHRCH